LRSTRGTEGWSRDSSYDGLARLVIRRNLADAEESEPRIQPAVMTDPILGLEQARTAGRKGPMAETLARANGSELPQRCARRFGLRPRLVILVAIGAVASVARAAETSHEDSRTVQLATIPASPADAMSGSEFARRTDGWPESERQRAAVAELVRGNLPHALRELQPVELHYQPPGGAPIAATIWVTPDYLSVGQEKDFLYTPLTLPSATEVAERFGCLLPTPKMVDAIYREARVHLTPQPLPAGPEMRSNGYYTRHQRLVDEQRAGVPPDVLISGHMKDVVLSDRLFGRPDRVAIYGWHRLDGRPIQPLSTVHGVRYADYSHGIRLVWSEVSVDGAKRSVYDVLTDPRLAPVLSDEGVLHDPHVLLDPRRAALAASIGASEVARTARP